MFKYYMDYSWERVMKKIFEILGIAILTIIIIGCQKDSTSPDKHTNNNSTIPELKEDSLYNVLNDYFQFNDHCVLGIFGYVDVPNYKIWKSAIGYFDDSRTRTLETKDKFIIGSVSKTFTATIILQLVEEGVIELDSSIIVYLPIFPAEILGNEYNLNNITVRQLLNHESGIADFIDIPAFTNRMLNEPSNTISPIEILSLVIEYRDPLFNPGTSFSYSSTNYILLGMMAEYLCEKPFYIILKERICLKIGLENTHLHSFDPDEGEIAHGYYGVFDGSTAHGSYGWTAGGIASSVEDLGKFMKALVRGELFQNGSTFDLMITPGQFSTYGLGIFAMDYGHGVSYGHTGKVWGYRARMIYNLEKDAVLCIGITMYGIQELPHYSVIPSLLDLLP